MQSLKRDPQTNISFTLCTVNQTFTYNVRHLLAPRPNSNVKHEVWWGTISGSKTHSSVVPDRTFSSIKQVLNLAHPVNVDEFDLFLSFNVYEHDNTHMLGVRRFACCTMKMRAQKWTANWHSTVIIVYTLNMFGSGRRLERDERGWKRNNHEFIYYWIWHYHTNLKFKSFQSLHASQSFHQVLISSNWIRGLWLLLLGWDG